MRRFFIHFTPLSVLTVYIIRQLVHNFPHVVEKQIYIKWYCIKKEMWHKTNDILPQKYVKVFSQLPKKTHNSDNVNSQGYGDYKPNIRIYAI